MRKHPSRTTVSFGGTTEEDRKSEKLSTDGVGVRSEVTENAEFGSPHVELRGTVMGKEECARRAVTPAKKCAVTVRPSQPLPSSLKGRRDHNAEDHQAMCCGAFVGGPDRAGRGGHPTRLDQSRGTRCTGCTVRGTSMLRGAHDPREELQDEQYAMTLKCQTCHMRMLYVPAVGQTGEHRKSTPLKFTGGATCSTTPRATPTPSTTAKAKSESRHVKDRVKQEPALERAGDPS